ncbi:MAG TPA: hypothetical protein PLP19_15765 [bacterium]|nr:hypothetical protein [bacterium]HPN44949.1 hypothetical protein [bacterium]
MEKVFLNNMILEKILVAEFGAQSELTRNEGFQSYILGRKEQSMREQLFNKKALNIVKLDSAEISKAMRLSKREYDLEFFNIYNDSIAKAIAQQIKSTPQSAPQIFSEYLEGREHPTWTAKWRDPDHINIHEALFSEPLHENSIVGPLKVDDEHWMMIKVVNWKDIVDFGGEEQQVWQQKIVEKLTMNHAVRNWDAYTREVMKGKSIDFDRDMFKKLADLFYDLNSARDLSNKDIIRRLFQNEDSTLSAFDLPDDETLLQQPFFNVDGTTWTVGNFRQALMSHPLVYRKTALDRGQFYLEFRRGIAALVRDTYLNKEAYKLGLDKDSNVQRDTKMWSDALIAAFERNQLLNNFGKALTDTTDLSRQSKLTTMYNEYLEELLHQYHPKIQVNTELYSRFEINKTQLFVTQPDQPYPVTVPRWPMFTDNNKVDYLPLKVKK